MISRRTKIDLAENNNELLAVNGFLPDGPVSSSRQRNIVGLKHVDNSFEKSLEQVDYVLCAAVYRRVFCVIHLLGADRVRRYCL